MKNTVHLAFHKKEDIWLRQGIKMLGTRVLSNFNVDDLCKATGKAKTSFYHFFNSKEKFFSRLAEYWEFYYTDAYINEISPVTDPLVKLEKLIELVHPKMKDELVWVHFKEKARSDANIKLIVERVEAKRIDVFCNIFKEMNYPHDIAYEKAKVFLFLFFGWSILEPDRSNQSKETEDFKKMSFDLLFDGDVRPGTSKPK